MVIASATSFGIHDCNCFWTGHTMAMMNMAAAKRREYPARLRQRRDDQHRRDDSRRDI